MTRKRKWKGEATGSGATVSLPGVSRRPADNSSTSDALRRFYYYYTVINTVAEPVLPNTTAIRPSVYPYVVAEVIACLSARLNYVSACPAAGGKFCPPFCGAQHNVPRIFFFGDGNLTAVTSTDMFVDELSILTKRKSYTQHT